MKRIAAVFIFVLCCLSASAQRLLTFLPDPDKANGAAVIVCPGGSYYWLDRKTEGTEVAEKLRDEGFAAFLLYYRHAGTRYFLFKDLAFPQDHYPHALNDLQNTIMDVRSKASEYGIDPDRIGAMGFSAGGHLVLDSGEETVVSNGVSSRPSFIVSIYPVVTLADENIVHKRSRKALLGSKANDQTLREHLSMELNIPDSMPPVFLANCKDDPTVDFRNSMVMEEALSKAGISHVHHVFEEGGHGFGASSEKAPWFPMFLDWYESL